MSPRFYVLCTSQSGTIALMSVKRNWIVEDHLGAGNERTVALYRKIEAWLLAMGSVTQSVSKTTITFKGPRHDFAGARPTSTGVIAFFDLMQSLPDDRCIKGIATYGRNLFVHHYALKEDADFDETFRSWLQESYGVGCGAHLLNPPKSEV